MPLKLLESKLNATAYEQGLANKTRVEPPVNATNGTTEPSKEETPGPGLGIAVLAMGSAYFLRRDR